MPYPLAPVRPNDGFGDTACDSGDYASAFDRCVADAGWAEKPKLNGKLIDGRYHGLGIACFIEGGASGPRENARIVIERDGSFAVYVGSSGVGQGVETIMAQIAADALEVPIEQGHGLSRLHDLPAGGLWLLRLARHGDGRQRDRRDRERADREDPRRRRRAPRRRGRRPSPWHEGSRRPRRTAAA